MARFSQTAYNLATDPSSRAALIDRLAIILAGGAGELTPARAALLSNLDALISSRMARTPIATFASFFAPSVALQATGAVLIDSGQLAANEYAILAGWFVSGDNNVAWHRAGVDWQHRNAANGANVDSGLLGPHAGTGTGQQIGQGVIHIPRKTFALNERVRLVKSVAMADDSGSIVYAQQSGFLMVFAA